MSLKLDMSKAYDRLEWKYLEDVMQQMGFANKWIELIMFCVKFVSFSILINGEAMGPIHPSQGLRHGGPLSPYLFLLGTEGLVTLLNQAGISKQVSGIKVYQGAPMVNHFLFTYDSVLFCKALLQENVAVQRILETYERVSGQKINRGKTSMVFSKKCVTRKATKAAFLGHSKFPEL